MITLTAPFSSSHYQSGMYGLQGAAVCCSRAASPVVKSDITVHPHILDSLIRDACFYTPLLGRPVTTDRVCMVALRWQSL
jgi:hypothetical protein